MTNAAPQGLLSIDPSNDLLLDEMPRLQLKGGGLEELELRLHTEFQLKGDDMQGSLHRTVRPEVLASGHPFPLAQQHVSRLLPLGHAKSARGDDHHFLATFEASEKWLRYDAERA